MASDPLCLRCGYNLRGLDLEKACPECGLGVARSLETGTELHRGRPIWIGRLAMGSRLLLTAQLGVLVLFFSLVFAGDELSGLLGTRAIVAVTGLLGVMHCVGLLLLTWPENQFERRQAGNRLRVVLRVWSWNGPVILLCVGAGYWYFSYVWMYAAIGAAFLLAPCWALTFLYLRRLAFRVLDPSLAEHCAIVGWGMALSIAAPFGFAGFEYNKAADDESMVVFFFIVIAIALFVIWSTFLLMVFTVAFGKASRVARQAWRDSDAAAKSG